MKKKEYEEVMTSQLLHNDTDTDVYDPKKVLIKTTQKQKCGGVLMPRPHILHFDDEEALVSWLQWHMLHRDNLEDVTIEKVRLPRYACSVDLLALPGAKADKTFVDLPLKQVYDHFIMKHDMKKEVTGWYQHYRQECTWMRWAQFQSWDITPWTYFVDKVKLPVPSENWITEYGNQINAARKPGATNIRQLASKWIFVNAGSSLAYLFFPTILQACAIGVPTLSYYHLRGCIKRETSKHENKKATRITSAEMDQFVDATTKNKNSIAVPKFIHDEIKNAYEIVQHRWPKAC
jgi:hypothetical protein